jgi:hypothetical protein
MAEFLQMAVVIAVLYIFYSVTIKKWNYSTEAQRKERRTLLKKRGLSNTFYFIHDKTLFFLNAASGGLFTFFWLFRQWQAVKAGFKRTSGAPLKYGPFLRTFFGLVTFFSLNALISRTCEYMHKKTPLPPIVWSTLWIAGLILVLFATGYGAKIFGYLLWCYAPCALQHRLNAFPTQALDPRPKPTEIAATVISLLLAATGYVFLRTTLR